MESGKESIYSFVFCLYSFSVIDFILLEGKKKKKREKEKRKKVNYNNCVLEFLDKKSIVGKIYWCFMKKLLEKSTNSDYVMDDVIVVMKCCQKLFCGQKSGGKEIKREVI